MKLNNVKVLDMKDGEVEKISYEGEEYVNVGKEDGKAGDIGLRISGGRSYVEVGGYYPIIDDDGLSFADDVGHKPYVADIDKHFVYFRKPARKGRVGDFLLAKNSDEGFGIKEGKMYEITSLAYGEYYVISNDKGSSKYINDPTENSNIDYEIIPKEQAQKAEESPESEYAVGKYVIFDEDGWDITAGKAYKITEFSGGEFFQALDDKGDVQSFRMFSEKEAHKVVEFIEGSPQVGDKILVVNPFLPTGYKEGDILVVTDVINSKLVSVDLPDNTSVLTQEFEIIERAEAEESSTEPAETKRKPGEFKAGDLARVIGTGCTDEIIGRYVTVKSEPKGSIRGGNVVVSDGKNTVLILGDDLEFVTRVEDRADL